MSLIESVESKHDYMIASGPRYGVESSKLWGPGVPAKH